MLHNKWSSGKKKFNWDDNIFIFFWFLTTTSRNLTGLSTSIYWQISRNVLTHPTSKLLTSFMNDPCLEFCCWLIYDFLHRLFSFKLMVLLISPKIFAQIWVEFWAKTERCHKLTDTPQICCWVLAGLTITVSTREYLQPFHLGSVLCWF